MFGVMVIFVQLSKVKCLESFFSFEKIKLFLLEKLKYVKSRI